MIDENTIYIVVEGGIVQDVYGVPKGYGIQTIDLDLKQCCDCLDDEREPFGPNEVVDKKVCLFCGGVIEEDA